jgi:hypothetical protein
VNKHFPGISVSPTCEHMTHQPQLISHCFDVFSHCFDVYGMVDLPSMVASLPPGQRGDDAALQIGGGTLPTGTEAGPPRPRPPMQPAAT